MLTRRILIGSAMLLFVAAIVAPVVSAMSLCAMPCCHHGSSAPVSLNGQPCPMKQCAITKAADDVAPAVAPSPVVAQATPTIVVAAAPAVVAQRAVDEHPIAPHHRPLHLVNSVFLI